MLPLNTRATVSGVQGSVVLKVLSSIEATLSNYDPSDFLIWSEAGDPPDLPDHSSGIGIVTPGTAKNLRDDCIVVENIQVPGAVAPGDVIRLTEGHSRVSVLYRRGSNSNTLFATERCNSYCIMCSQPPREVDDHWRVDEMLATIRLIDRDETLIGISGGEPTLLGDDLLIVLNQARICLPDTSLHILSNGRRFADKEFTRSVCAVRHPDVCWGIPLYSDCPQTHDYIVQASGAWSDTVLGLYNLARQKALIELRVVVQQANIEALGELAYFIFRNLTFVNHVAFMGLEPMGFARHNRDKLWVDPADCAASLQDAVHFLANRGITTSIYNIPLCTLPEDLWPFCAKSISDWKNVYMPACSACDIRENCCGFFHSIRNGWISKAIAPIRNQELRTG